MFFSLVTAHTYLFGLLLALTVFTFFLYGLDKFFAIQKFWRIRERTLLLLALCGGSLGAWLGVVIFRHKKSKPLFMILLMLITLVQAALILWLLSDSPLDPRLLS